MKLKRFLFLILLTMFSLLIVSQIAPTTVHAVEEIEEYVFKGCTHLREVGFPNSLKSIGYNAFIETMLKSVKVPTNCKYTPVDKDNQNDYFNGLRISFPIECVVEFK